VSENDAAALVVFMVICVTLLAITLGLRGR
jgi:hypothetical protein